MTVSELIEQLRAVAEESGEDAPVLVCNVAGDLDDVTEVTFETPYGHRPTYQAVIIS